MINFGFCFDCDELNYAISDRNGVFESNNMSNNHVGHDVHCFLAPKNYPTPICNVLTKLDARLPISHNEIVIFKLAIDLGALDKYKKNRIEEEPTIIQQTLF